MTTYAPLSSTGEEVELFSNGRAQVFYSVASLRVFEAVAADPKKAVILVARHSHGKDKTEIIHASIGQAAARRYVSHLVVDEKTAEMLLWY